MNFTANVLLSALRLDRLSPEFEKQCIFTSLAAGRRLAHFPLCCIMRRCLCVLSLLLCTTFTTYAQFEWNKASDIKLVRELPLIVVLQEEEPSVTTRSTKKDSSNPDTSRNAQTNNNLLRAQIARYWKFSSEVQFKTKAEMDALRDHANQVYSVMSVFTYWHSDSRVSSTSTRANLEKRQAIHLQLLGKGRSKDRNVYLQQLTKGSVPKSEITFALQVMQQYLEYQLQGQKASDLLKAVKTNESKLKDKILLLDEETLETALTKAEITAAYPFPFQIVDRAFIEKAVDEEAAQYACVWTAPINEDDHPYAQLVMSTDKAEIIGYSKPSYNLLVFRHSYTLDRGRRLINVYDLKDFAAYAAGNPQ